jgi:hypothetical protein
MSISGSNKQENPVSKWVEWNGTDGKFYYYDREKKEKVDMPKKFQVIGLDQLSTIKGWDESASSGVYSNEVRETTKEKLVVKNFKGDLLAEGLYQDIKGRLSGGKFCKSVYAVLVEKGGSTEIINLSLMGSALGPWIDAKINISGGFVITCGTNPESKKKGRTVYFEPTFEIKPLPEGEVRDTVVQLDRDVLQPYLNQYLKQGEEDTVEEAPQIQKTGLEQPAPSLAYAEEDGEIDSLPF